MKAISLWQPWASAVALGLKTIETRNWATSYRGPLAIHAGKKNSGDVRREFDFFVRDRGFGVAFAQAGYTDFEDLPLGAIVATCRVAECVPVSVLKEANNLTPAEAGWGDYSPGRFGWVLENIKRLEQPVRRTGRQGFFEWDEIPF